MELDNFLMYFVYSDFQYVPEKMSTYFLAKLYFRFVQ